MNDRLSAAIRAALDGTSSEVAMQFHGVNVEWSYIRNVVERLDTLLDELGFGRGSAIGFVPRNRPSFCGALLSLLAGRRTIVMVYAFQSSTALASDLKKLEVDAIIADTQDWNDETLGAVSASVSCIGLNADLASDEPVTLVRKGGSQSGGEEKEPMLQMLTSGTTGAPKRHPVSYDTIQNAIIGASVLDSGKGEKGEPGTVNFPLSNISGIYSYLPMAVARRLVVLMEKFDINEWLEFVREHRPNTVVLPPAGVQMLLDKDVAPDDLSSVKYILVGTSPLDRNAQKSFEERYDLTVLLSYGATEFCGAATAMTAALYEEFGPAKFGSVGRPQPGNDVQVVDPETGKALPAGETGVLRVKIGALGNDYIQTTDLGMLDEDGFLFIKGRVDGVIMRGGFKILPATVEAVINRYPGVSASCVVGKADTRLGQVPVAVLELKPGAEAPTTEALEAHTRDHLPSTNIPTAFLVLDSLPRTPSLKVDLKAVRALVNQDSL